MTTFGIYREVKRPLKSHETFRPEPKKVKNIEAEDSYSAAVKFCDGLPTGWRDRLIEVSRYGSAKVWIRHFTPSGRYKGETCFLVWKKD